MDIFKFISRKSTLDRGLLTLGVSNPNFFWNHLIRTTLDVSQIQYLHGLIFHNYNPCKFKFLTIRPHQLYNLIKNSEIFNEYPELLYRGIQTIIPEEFYKTIVDNYLTFLKPLLKGCDFIMSLEYNNNVLNDLHIHIVILNITNKTFKSLISQLKQEYDPITNIRLESNLPIDCYSHKKGYAVYPKKYSLNEISNALYYYMGIDKSMFKGDPMRLKKSYHKNIYRINKLNKKKFDFYNLETYKWF